MHFIVHFEENYASVEVCVTGYNLARVRGLRSLQRGEGNARRVMERVCTWADEEGYTLFLTAKPFGPDGLSHDELVAFYKSVGFIVTGQDLEGETRMGRKPRGEL